MDSDRFSEVITFAIEKEQEAVDTYTIASGIVRRTNVRETLLSLAKQEEAHKRKLMGIQGAPVPSSSVRDVPDLKLADFSDNVRISPDMDYQQVLTVAMKREQKAHNLYTTLASNTSDPELRSLFEHLAHEEARHKLALEKEYDEHVLTEN
jgi:rubrerythrin